MSIHRTSIFLPAIPLGLLVPAGESARGRMGGNKKALVIVSGHGGYTSHELGKASSMRQYLLDKGCPPDDILYLTQPSDPDSDGPATIKNVEEAFEWMIEEATEGDEVLVYISDHEQDMAGEICFLFDDGSIPAGRIGGHLGSIGTGDKTTILNGKRSSLAGPQLSGTGGPILCSMGPYQTFDPDLFDITVSLREVPEHLSGMEAYLAAFDLEVGRLQGTGQDPVLIK